MTDLERSYVIPLRSEWSKVPKYKRAKKAVTALKQFLSRHMKSEDVRLGNSLNLAVWSRGIKNPPHKLEVTAVKLEKEGYVLADLKGVKIVRPSENKEESKGLAATVKDAILGKKGADVVEAVVVKKEKTPVSGKEIEKENSLIKRRESAAT
ncbi:60S ribosomal protein L31 [Candidatus Woesearchaeota archaeon]|nr:60S ribosomal protein L31 [Candidatus Woesearchaeota archaeon]